MPFVLRDMFLLENVDMDHDRKDNGQRLKPKAQESEDDIQEEQEGADDGQREEDGRLEPLVAGAKQGLHQNSCYVETWKS